MKFYKNRLHKSENDELSIHDKTKIARFNIFHQLCANVNRAKRYRKDERGGKEIEQH